MWLKLWILPDAQLLWIYFKYGFHTFGILWKAQTPIGTPFEHVQLYLCPDKISSICNQFMGSSAPIPITTRYQWRYHYPVRSTGTFTYDAPDKFYSFFVCVVPADGERSLIPWWILVVIGSCQWFDSSEFTAWVDSFTTAAQRHRWGAPPGIGALGMVRGLSHRRWSLLESMDYDWCLLLNGYEMLWTLAWVMNMMTMMTMTTTMIITIVIVISRY